MRFCGECFRSCSPALAIERFGRNRGAQLEGSITPEHPTDCIVSANLEREPLSVPELLGGGVALAIVALVAIGGMPVAQPQKSLLSPARYASVSIETSEASAKLSIEQPRELSDAAGITRDAQSTDTRARTGTSVPNGAELPSADRSPPPAEGWPFGIGIQQYGIEGKSSGAFTDVVSGPPSSTPLRDPPPSNSQRRSMPEPPSAGAEPTFIGGWTDNGGRCRGRRAPLVISFRAAKTASGECDFGSVAREAANRWRVAAICAAEGSFWRANIALKLREPHLTWSSERGTETYVRCKP
jgi:hypothetical protein